MTGPTYTDPGDIRTRYDDDSLEPRDETPAEQTARHKLEAKLEADPNSTQGTTSYADGQSPDELAAAAPASLTAPTTDIERIEQELGFTFSAPGDTTSPPATRTVICRDPECPNTGEQIAIHPDTPQPVHCGGCGTVLLCDHTTETLTTMTGTLAAPVKTTHEICTRCGTTTTTTRDELPPINLANLPIGILDTIGTTPGDVTFTGGSSGPA